MVLEPVLLARRTGSRGVVALSNGWRNEDVVDECNLNH